MTLNIDELLAELPTLETERLLLRKITPTDEADVFAYASDPEVPKYMPWEPHQSLEDTRVYLASVFERYRQHTPGPWGIVHLGARDGESWDALRGRAARVFLREGQLY